MNVQELVDRWFQFANGDLNVAVRCLTEVDDGQWIDPEPRAACFHCLQAAEKSLKGFLVYCGIEPPRIHDLKTLCEMAMKNDSEFKQIHFLCSDLTQYAVEVRYPDDFLEIDVRTADTAIEHARKIFDFCKKKVLLTQ